MVRNFVWLQKNLSQNKRREVNSDYYFRRIVFWRVSHPGAWVSTAGCSHTQPRPVPRTVRSAALVPLFTPCIQHQLAPLVCLTNSWYAARADPPPALLCTLNTNRSLSPRLHPPSSFLITFARPLPFIIHLNRFMPAIPMNTQIMLKLLEEQV